MRVSWGSVSLILLRAVSGTDDPVIYKYPDQSQLILCRDKEACCHLTTEKHCDPLPFVDDQHLLWLPSTDSSKMDGLLEPLSSKVILETAVNPSLSCSVTGTGMHRELVCVRTTTDQEHNLLALYLPREIFINTEDWLVSTSSTKDCPHPTLLPYTNVIDQEAPSFATVPHLLQIQWPTCCCETLGIRIHTRYVDPSPTAFTRIRFPAPFWIHEAPPHEIVSLWTATGTATDEPWVVACSLLTTLTGAVVVLRALDGRQ